MLKLAEATGVQELLDSLTYPIFLIDADKRIHLFNKETVKKFGAIDKSKQQHCYQVVFQSDKPHAFCPMPAAVRTGKETHKMVRGPDGSWLRISVYPTDLTTDTGDRLYLHTIRDSSQIMLDSVELVLQEELLGRVNDAIFVMDKKGNIKYANRGAWEGRGYTEDEFLKLNVRDINLPERAGFVKDMFAKVERDEQATFETIHVRKDGSTLPVEVSSRTFQFGDVDGFIAVARDVSDRKVAEEELRLKSTILEASIDSVFLHDKEGHLYYINEAAYKTRGYSKEELLAMTLRQLVTPENVNTLTSNIKNMKTKGVTTYQSNTVCKDGTIIPIEIHAQFINWQGRKLIFSVVHDLTARKAAEARVQNQYATLRGIVESVRSPIFSLDTNYRYTSFNESHAQVMKALYGADIEIGKSVLDYQTVTEDRKKAKDNLDRALHGERVVEEEFSGEEGRHRLFFEVMNSPITDDDGAVLGVSVYAHDITKQKTVQEELRRERDIAQLYLDIVGVMVVAINAQGKVTMINQQGAKILGYSEKEIIGRDWFDDFIPKKLRREVKNVFTRIVKGDIKGVDTYENPVLGRDGREKMIAWRNKNVFDEKGKFRFTLSSGEDISDVRAAREELGVSYERLRQVVDGVIKALSLTVETRDPYTAGHQRRVAKLAVAIAGRLGWDEEKIKGLEMAATIHDIGKMYVPAEILNKPGKLDPIEFELIKLHSVAGYGIIKDIVFEAPVALMVRQHHERLNGSGYPDGLKDKKILPGAKIMAVADVVEAMSSDRPYRPGFGVEAALKEVDARKGELYDPEAVTACLAIFKQDGFSFE